ncbi:translation initiation factor IF-3 [Mycolicibacterium doricum]|uniref:Translation initiation factor IF-3 n=1 Tax=Mycolicibacterium doricum TaxID=126673 RepID=A0A7I7VU51_9MYCO|nr:translation initiation factor IF-3 [Mycolicibacterium doricum]
MESHSHRWPPRHSGPVIGIEDAGSALSAQAARAAIGRQRALQRRAILLWRAGAEWASGLPGEHNIGGPISTETRVNERIRVPEVRLIGPGGEQVGIVRIEDALRVAADADLDLVEVAPDAKPPVCKIMDYGKFKYETAQKARESRKNQQQTVVKEQKLRPKIDPHDYETKKGHVIRFLEAGSKVKVTIMFRGREQSRPELGFRLLQRLGADVAEYGFVETSAKQDGRNMTMVLAPHRGAKTRAKAAEQAERPRESAPGPDAT